MAFYITVAALSSRHFCPDTFVLHIPSVDPTIILESKELAPRIRVLLIFYTLYWTARLDILDSNHPLITYDDPPNENPGILIVDTVQVLPPSLVVMSPVTPSPLATVLT